MNMQPKNGGLEHDGTLFNMGDLWTGEPASAVWDPEISTRKKALDPSGSQEQCDVRINWLSEIESWGCMGWNDPGWMGGHQSSGKSHWWNGWWSRLTVERLPKRNRRWLFHKKFKYHAHCEFQVFSWSFHAFRLNDLRTQRVRRYFFLWGAYGGCCWGLDVGPTWESGSIPIQARLGIDLLSKQIAQLLIWKPS